MATIYKGMPNNLLHFEKQTCKTLPNNCPKSVSLFFVLCKWCPARLALRGRALPARRLAPARVELGAEKLELVAVGLSGAAGAAHGRPEEDGPPVQARAATGLRIMQRFHYQDDFEGLEFVILGHNN